MSRRLRLYDEGTPEAEDFLSTEASLALRQQQLDGGGSVSATNFISQISMLGDNFNEDLLTNIYMKFQAMFAEMFDPDQWAHDLVEGMPFYEIDVDMFGRPWSQTLAPDGYLKASEMGKVPVIAVMIMFIASKIPGLVRGLGGATAAALTYRKNLKSKAYFRRVEEKIDDIIDQTSGSSAPTRAKIQRDILYAEELLELTSAGLATNHHSYRQLIVDKLKESGSISD